MTNRETARTAAKSLVLKCWLLAFIVSWLSLSAYSPGLAQEAPTAVRIVEPADGAVMVQSEISPPVALTAGAEGAYRMQIRPATTTRCFGAPAKPIDAVVLLDTSASAGIPGPGSNLFRSAEIVRSFWAQADQPVYSSGEDRDGLRSRLGLVTVDIAISGTEVNLRLPLTDTAAAIDAALSNLNTGADSRFDSGISAAAQYLRDTARPEAESVLIVILHDSFFALQDEVIGAAQRAAADGIGVFIIGNRINIPEQEQIESGQALSMVSSADSVFLDPQAEDLRRLYVLASGSDETVAVRGLVAGAELISDSGASIIGGSVDGEFVSDTAARWQYSMIRQDEAAEWGFRFRVGSEATGAVGVDAMIQGLDCNGFPFQIGGESTAATVVISTPTPVSTRDEPGAEPPITSPSVERDGPSGNLGGVFQWLLSGLRLGPIALPWWLLLLLLLLLLLIVFIRLLHRPSPSQRPRGPQSPPQPPPPLPEPEPKKPDGNVIRPGDSEKIANTAWIRSALLQAQKIQGRIPVGGTGSKRPKITVKWLTRKQDLPRELPLDSFGKEFWWDDGSQTHKMPISLLLEAVGGRVSERTPIHAAYTSVPGDYADIETRIDQSGETIIAHTTNLYKASVGESRPQFYWLHLYFVENPSKKQLSIQPTQES